MCRILKTGCIVLIMGAVLTGCQKEEKALFYEVSEEELEEKGVSSEEETEKDGENAVTVEDTIFVHVCGEVVSPGVYELHLDSRVYEAIEAAGGVSEKAAEESLNQAEYLMDGQQIYVPSEEELLKKEEEAGVSADGKVNINKASKEELMTLSGVGEAKADAIIRYRSEKGSFSSIEEIMEIEGIKEGVFRKIEDRITVS